MNILIVSTYYQCGGAELQAIFEQDELNTRGNKTLYLTFDPSLSSGEVRHEDHLNLVGNYSTLNRRIHNSRVDNTLLKMIRNVIDDFKPDIIHLHNITYAFLTIAKACEGYLTIQTLHDYSYVCFKDGRCLLTDKSLCSCNDFKECGKRCFNDNLVHHIIFQQKYKNRIKEIEYRKKYVKLLISPSRGLTKAVSDHGYKAITIPNALGAKDFAGFHKEELDYGNKIVLFIGTINRDKGIIELLNIYKASEYKSLRLKIIGPIGEGISKEDFLELCQKSGAEYLGRASHENVISFLKNAFSVTIPSLWMENYPNSALEGELSESIVCGSNRGGIKDIVVDDKLLFDILDTDSVKDCLHFIDDMNSEQRQKIIEKQTNQFRENNTPDIYFQRLFSAIDKVGEN